MSDEMRDLLPAITEEDRQLLHYNPNTDDLVEWAQDYALKAVRSAQFASVPYGYKLVPIKPTREMLIEGDGVIEFHGWSERVWATMLACAPAENE